MPFLLGPVAIVLGDEQFDDLILSAEVVADLYERRITKYNDPKIAALNPDRTLPHTDIIPVRRSDGSGTTSVLTTRLEWAATDDTDRDGGAVRFGTGDQVQNWTLDSGTQVQWPADVIGGQGNERVTQRVKQNPGGLGYVIRLMRSSKICPGLEISTPTAMRWRWLSDHRSRLGLHV